MDSLRRRGPNIFLWLVAVFFIFSLGFYTGQNQNNLAFVDSNITNPTLGQPASVDFAPFWKAWNTLSQKYVPTATSTDEVTDQDKVWGAIEGLAASMGDPYTVFFPPQESEQFASDIRGNFEGVGMELVSQNGSLVVIAPLKGSPAERAGMLSKDIITKIDGKDTNNLTTEDAVNLIRGPKGTPVTLTVLREGRPQVFDVEVVRDTIDIPTINTQSLPSGVFKIDLYSFSATSPNLFRGALREFVESGDHKLILDLRGNPGGYLEAAIDMASWFLPSGKVVVRENFGEGKDETIYRSKGYDIFNDNLKFVILVDGGSASAAEILAGALSEHDKATLVGETTFGKGSVQELVDITPDTSLKVTIARWLTPNGVSISKHGIKPDVEVELTEDNMKAGIDTQLDKAIEILNQQ